MTNHKYSGELWIDENGETNFKFHVIGGNFLDAQQALLKFVECIQERLDNAQKCPYFEEENND